MTSIFMMNILVLPITCRRFLVIKDGDNDDPHGVFPYVRTIEWDEFVKQHPDVAE